MPSWGLHFLTGKQAQNRLRPDFMRVGVFGEEFPLCVQGFVGEVRGWGVLGAGDIEKRMKAAGLLVLLPRRNIVKLLEEACQGCALGGGLGGRGRGREERRGCTSTRGRRSSILKGGEGGRRRIDRGLLGGGGVASGSSKLTVFAGRRERTRGFQSMSPGSDMETIATIRGIDHRKTGE